MALYGSASSNLSPILFRGNNRSLGVNVLIHQDESGSMGDLIAFYSDGSFIGGLQDALLQEKIGDNITSYPNLYSYFGVFSRNPLTPYTISNINGTLQVSECFVRGEATGSETITKWTGSNYFTRSQSLVVNICNENNRLSGYDNNVGTTSPKSEDVHGNLWSVYTTPNAISTGTPGAFGSIFDSNVRKGSTTIIITNSDEQDSAPIQMLNTQVVVKNNQTRTINGSTGELVTRNYRVIALSSYNSTDGYDGILFYGSTSSQPYGYVKLGTTSYTITRSATAPTWIQSTTPPPQLHNTLTLALETRGALFKLRNVFSTTSSTDNRVGFSKCLADFIKDTV